ncbi:MAG TPA: ABC transporter ATP-binding protein [Candidatus Dormibacteraeota bacterium]|nr:ABC transporter ATP-binding protein [Candidatus Dormibacteraeota bacterium]
MTAPAATEPVLQVTDLAVEYRMRHGTVRAVNGVSFDIQPGERLGLAGESGSGKSTAAMAIMGLIRSPGRVTQGSVVLNGRDVTRLEAEQMRRIRLADMAMIPQGAMNSLNPVRRVRTHFADSIRAHSARVGDREVRRRMVELLGMVDLGEEVADLYPLELSGGMKQRVCIALSICLQPRVIIADEPTSALDVVMQRQVMQTLRAVQETLGAAVLLIGHDMGLLAQFVDRLGVMYEGKLVELGPVRSVFREPLHPYTQVLIRSLPSLDERDPVRAAKIAQSTRVPSAVNAVMTEARPGHWVAVEEAVSR